MQKGSEIRLKKRKKQIRYGARKGCISLAYPLLFDRTKNMTRQRKNAVGKTKMHEGGANKSKKHRKSKQVYRLDRGRGVRVPSDTI